MLSKTTISVIMITYNHEKYIKQAIEGVLMQETDFEVELIISNDASTDQTNKMVNETIANYKGKINIRYYNHKKNKGMNENWLWAVKQAQGKYIALCEGDDYWTDPLKLQKQVDFLEENEEYVACGHNRKRIDENNNILIENEWEYLKSKAIFTQCILFRNLFPDKIYFKHAKNIFNADTFLFHYLEQFGNIGYLDFIGANYRISKSGIWSEVDKVKQYNIGKKSLFQMLEYFKEVNNKKFIKIIEKEITLIETHIIKFYIEEKEIFKAIKHLYIYNKQSIKHLNFLRLNYLKINIYYSYKITLKLLK